MSSFFTLPASQRKRKRIDSSSRPSKKLAPPSKANRSDLPTATERESSYSSSDSDNRPPNDGDLHSAHTDTDSDASGGDDETGAERRLRLAERYLENLKSSAAAETGFDAADVDRDIIAARLQEDAAETKGQMYRHVADDYAWTAAVGCQFRGQGLTTTSVAACPPYVFTATKDKIIRKWELAPPRKLPLPSKVRHTSSAIKHHGRPQAPTRRRPAFLLSTRNSADSTTSSSDCHTAAILALAGTSCGRYLASGGADRKVIIWATTTLTPLRTFTQHRAEVTSLAFRNTTDAGASQLFSASADRTIKTWNIDRTGIAAYVETLFGHQDSVLDVATLPASADRCLSVGARDRTVRLWKVAEETQLVFRAGGGGASSKSTRPAPNIGPAATVFAEGSIDRVAQIDDITFVTGADNGTLSLWTAHKKKPVFSIAAAHGVEPALRPDEAFAERELVGRSAPVGGAPRWITALRALPLADLVLSGSWDGNVRVWRVSGDRKRLEAVGVVGMEGGVRGVVNDLALLERGEKGREGMAVVVATGKEHRLGRWQRVEGRNGALVFEVPRKAVQPLAGEKA